MKRALGRVVCPQCGASYNTYFQDVMPKEEGICDRCGAALEARADDNEETFKKRFETYITSTSPLLDYYEEANKLEKVLSGDSAEETFKSIVNVLGSEDVDN
jgi:adenylate kinase